MTDTDMQVLDILDSDGPATAGQLADLTGLTTGAITGMLNRLEEAGLVSRERDPNDGRRVIVRLASDKEGARGASATLDSLSKAWDEIAARYDDGQITLVLDFLKRGATLTRSEIVRLRETPANGGKVFSALLGDIENGQLTVSGAIPRLRVRADAALSGLYTASFEGTVPDVKTKDGAVTIRYPRRGLLTLGTPLQRDGGAEVTLNAAIPWRIAIQGAAMAIVTEPDGLNLAGLEVKAAVSKFHLDLPAPSGVVPVLIEGGASEIVVRRPKGAAARVHLKGWVSMFTFDDHMYTSVGTDVRLQSANYAENAPYYDIEVSSSASTVTITTDL
jgi:predicted transcriptional regulator